MTTATVKTRPKMIPSAKLDQELKVSPKKNTHKQSRRPIGKQLVASLGKKVGAPVKLTQAIIDRLVPWVEQGNFIQQAVAAEGIPRSSYYFWLNKGTMDAANGVKSIHRELLDTIAHASAKAEHHALQKLLEGTTGHGAYSWYLERRFQSTWGARLRLSLEEAQGFVRQVLGVLTVHISDRALIQKIVQDVQRIEGKQRELLANK